MSVKHVKLYYKEICDQYSDLLQELKDFEKEAQEGLIEPERIDNIKETIQPLMNNYQRISYIMYLLNLPNKKEKAVKYKRQNNKLLNTLSKDNSLEKTIEENSEVINKLKNKTV